MDGFSYKTFIELLEKQPGQASIPVEEVECVKHNILVVLKRYGIEADKVDTIISPSVITIEIIPQQGYKVFKIRKYIDDIERDLKEYGLCRVIAPLSGKNALAVEVPRSKRRMVYLREVLESKEFQEYKAELPIALGISTENKPIITDLRKMPHLLIGGTTGMGKSVLLNTIIVSLLFRKSPEEVKFMLIDPKMVDLGHYSKIKEQYLVKIEGIDEDIISSFEHVITALNSLCSEMDRRYELLRETCCRSNRDYNQKLEKGKLSTTEGYKPMPYIIVVIDEFTDLIIAHGKAIEIPIARLAQRCRSVGIHLSIATHKTSSDVITGILKANFPARIALKVQTFAESRTILDMTGAQLLLDKGNMLVNNNEIRLRVQGAFIDGPEIERICDWIAHNNSDCKQYALPTQSISDTSTNSDDVENDPLFDDAARMIVKLNKPSTAMLQLRFKIGYNRAAKIMDQLEQAGIIDRTDKKNHYNIIDHLKFQLLRKRLSGNEVSLKNYQIVGNEYEINRIISTHGIIDIGRDVVFKFLNPSSINYVTSGFSKTGFALDALKNAVKDLRKLTSASVGKVLFNIWVSPDNNKLSPAEIKSVVDYYETEFKNIEVFWGLAHDNDLKDEVKVTLIAVK